MAGNDQMKNLYDQEKFREMPTKELRECIQHDNDHSRVSRAQKVLGERGDTGGGTGGTGRFEEGNVRQGGGQRGMKEEGGQPNYGDERGQGEVGQRGFGEQTGGRETQRGKSDSGQRGIGETTPNPNRDVNRDDREEFNR